MTVTKDQVGAAIKATAVMAEAIREAGEIPSGHLYAMVMGNMDLPTYNGIIKVLKGTGLVKESANVLTWTGPMKGEA